MINIRASSCDRISICNYSSKEPEMEVDSSGPWANFGNAVHSVMADIVKHDLTALPDISKVIEEYEIEDEKALRISCHIGLKAYTTTIRPSINRDHLITETKHSRPIGDKWTLSGHPDIACLLNDPTILFVGDWKSGDRADHFSQLKAYAFILLKYFPGVETVLLGTYFIRIGQEDVRSFSREYIEEQWADSFITCLEGESLKPSFSSCQYCPHHECEARDKLNRATMASLTEVNSDMDTALIMANQYENVKLLERKIAMYKEHIKDSLLLNDEPITLDNGKVLELIESHRSTLFLVDALDVLKDYFSVNTDELMILLKPCVTLKKTKLLDVISGHAARGMKGKEKVRILDEMESVGAVEDKMSYKLILKKGE